MEFALKLGIYVNHEIPVEDMKISPWVGEIFEYIKKAKGSYQEYFGKKQPIQKKKKWTRSLNKHFAK